MSDTPVIGRPTLHLALISALAVIVVFAVAVLLIDLTSTKPLSVAVDVQPSATVSSQPSPSEEQAVPIANLELSDLVTEEAPSELRAVPANSDGIVEFQFRDSLASSGPGLPAVVATSTTDESEFRALAERLGKDGAKIDDVPQGWPEGSVAVVVDRRPSYYQVIFRVGNELVNISAEDEGSWSLVDAWAKRTANRLAKS